MLIEIKKLKKTEIKKKIKNPINPCSPVFKSNLKNLLLNKSPYPRIDKEKKINVNDKIKTLIILI